MRSYGTQASLKLFMPPKMTLNSQSYCFHFLGAEIIGVCHYIQFTGDQTEGTVSGKYATNRTISELYPYHIGYFFFSFTWSGFSPILQVVVVHMW